MLLCEQTGMIVMSDALLGSIVHSSLVYFMQTFEAVLWMLQNDIVYSVWLPVALTGCQKTHKENRVPDL